MELRSIFMGRRFVRIRFVQARALPASKSTTHPPCRPGASMPRTPQRPDDVTPECEDCSVEPATRLAPLYALPPSRTPSRRPGSKEPVRFSLSWFRFDPAPQTTRARQPEATATACPAGFQPCRGSRTRRTRGTTPNKPQRHCQEPRSPSFRITRPPQHAAKQLHRQIEHHRRGCHRRERRAQQTPAVQSHEVARQAESRSRKDQSRGNGNRANVAEHHAREVIVKIVEQHRHGRRHQEQTYAGEQPRREAGNGPRRAPSGSASWRNMRVTSRHANQATSA